MFGKSAFAMSRQEVEDMYVVLLSKLLREGCRHDNPPDGGGSAEMGLSRLPARGGDSYKPKCQPGE